MNWLLILVVLVLAWNLVWGFSKGALRVLYSMVAWILILVFVTWATPYVSNFLVGHTALGEGIETTALTYVLVFLLTSVVFRLIAFALDLVSKLPLIGEVNHLLGLLAGAVKGFLLVWLAFAFIAMAHATAAGAALTSIIRESEALLWFYENNPVLEMILIFL